MIYFDNAATSFPKPSCVYKAAERALCECAGNPGRGGHRLASGSAYAVYEARESVARLFCCDTPERVVFTHNATEALNAAIKGLAKAHGEILISDIEHNSVRRPAYSLASSGCKVRIYRTYADKEDTVRSFRESITKDTCLAVACHRSNICGRELPINEIGILCRQRDIPFIVDAAQSAGACAIDFEKTSASVLCAPGHKGILGTMGGGFMLISDRVAPEEFTTVTEGGSGVDSQSIGMPLVFPERLEAGTLPVPAICSMKAGADFIMDIGADEIGRRECAVMLAAKERLEALKGKVAIYAADENNGSVLLFNVIGKDPEDVAAYLDREGICVRAGFHCAPLAHKSIGTPSCGAVRASFGYFNTKAETDVLYKALKRI